MNDYYKPSWNVSPGYVTGTTLLGYPQHTVTISDQLIGNNVGSNTLTVKGK